MRRGVVAVDAQRVRRRRRRPARERRNRGYRHRRVDCGRNYIRARRGQRERQWLEFRDRRRDGHHQWSARNGSGAQGRDGRHGPGCHASQRHTLRRVHRLSRGGRRRRERHRHGRTGVHRARAARAHEHADRLRRRHVCDADESVRRSQRLSLITRRVACDSRRDPAGGCRSAGGTRTGHGVRSCSPHLPGGRAGRRLLASAGCLPADVHQRHVGRRQRQRHRVGRSIGREQRRGRPDDCSRRRGYTSRDRRDHHQVRIDRLFPGQRSSGRRAKRDGLRSGRRGPWRWRQGRNQGQAYDRRRSGYEHRDRADRCHFDRRQRRSPRHCRRQRYRCWSAGARQ